MSKVKPQVGQVWNIGGHIDRDYRTVIEVNSDDVIWSGSSYTPLAHFFDYGFEFVPQNYLEWLAVNVEVWEFDDCDFIAREESRELYIEDSESEYCSQFQYYTRQQWQNMRYKLGLDEKPRVSAGDWAEMLRDKN